MNNEKINYIINELKYLLSQKHNDFKGIYYYGSRRRKDNQEDSDYDLMFVFNREVDRKLKEEIVHLLYSYELENDIIIDCRVYSADDIENIYTPFTHNVKKEGLFYGV
ncbi:MAG: nucleotidyltransferase domain-containing protein [Ignavibacteriales bacterium]|nr:nucleotidyltransferase domain-containing protein [Ignavibacteriales bacterium]